MSHPHVTFSNSDSTQFSFVFQRSTACILRARRLPKADGKAAGMIHTPCNLCSVQNAHVKGEKQATST